MIDNITVTVTQTRTCCFSRFSLAMSHYVLNKILNSIALLPDNWVSPWEKRVIEMKIK